MQQGDDFEERSLATYSLREYSATTNEAAVAREGYLPELREDEPTEQKCSGCGKTGEWTRFLFLARELISARPSQPPTLRPRSSSPAPSVVEWGDTSLGAPRALPFFFLSPLFGVAELSPSQAVHGRQLQARRQAQEDLRPDAQAIFKRPHLLHRS